MSNKDDTPEWVGKVQAEALQYVTVVQNNFLHGIQTATEYLPDRKDKAQRAEVLDTFLDATIGLAVQFVAEFFHSGPTAEEQAIKMMRDKFAHIREAKARGEGSRTLGPSGTKPVLKAVPTA